jgi:hypothetical protein
MKTAAQKARTAAENAVNNLRESARECYTGVCDDPAIYSVSGLAEQILDEWYNENESEPTYSDLESLAFDLVC